MIALPIIASLLMTAAVVVLGYFINESLQERDWTPVILGFIGALLLGLLAFVMIMIWRAATSPTITLVKADWTCTKSHVRRRPVTTMVGKTPVTTMATSTVCDLYARRTG